MANKILKGGISNYIYRWDTNAGACDSCQELNNTIYNSENDIPEKPHPNCKCSVEMIEEYVYHGTNAKIPKGYKVELTSQSINAGDSLPKYDLIKKINVKVTFTVSKTEQNVSLYTSKEREQLAEVNKPDIDSLEITASKSYVPIKYSTTQQAYVVTNENDTNWYNYSNKVWAMVYVDSLSNINSIKDAGKLSTAQANSTGNIYYWIPRFSTDGQALYNASNYPITNIQITAINDNTKKMSLFSVGTATLSADTNEFNSNGKKGLWKAKNLLNSDGTMQAFNRTKFGPVQY